MKTDKAAEAQIRKAQVEGKLDNLKGLASLYQKVPAIPRWMQATALWLKQGLCRQKSNYVKRSMHNIRC